MWVKSLECRETVRLLMSEKVFGVTDIDNVHFSWFELIYAKIIYSRGLGMQLTFVERTWKLMSQSCTKKVCMLSKELFYQKSLQNYN